MKFCRNLATPWTSIYQVSCCSQSLEFAQTHIHRVDDAIQPSHPLSSPSPPAFNCSQHPVLKKKKLNWGNSKDLIGFMQLFMNQASFHLAERKELWGTVQNERLLWAKWSKNKEVILWRSGLLVARSLSFRGRKGSICHQMTSLVLIRWYLID